MNESKGSKLCCGQKAVVDGALSLATLGSLCGVKGLKAAEETEASVSALPVPSLPLTTPSPAVLAAMAGARPLSAGQLPPQLGGPAVPGMPENQQMQANLNDYYARWWTSYALEGDLEAVGCAKELGKPRRAQEEKPKEQPMAFDKEAP